jgi:hypothetical protein
LNKKFAKKHCRGTIQENSLASGRDEFHMELVSGRDEFHMELVSPRDEFYPKTAPWQFPSPFVAS